MVLQLISSEVNRAFIIPMETITSLAPLLAAAIARRSIVGEPAGRIALGWGLSTAGTLVKMAQSRQYLPESLWSSRFELLLVTAFLLYGTMEWIDGVSRRTRWLAIAGWCTAWAFSLLLANRRELALVMQPIQAALILTVSGLALGSRVRGGDARLARADWLWILMGHITYFAAMLIRMPLMESLVRHHFSSGMAVHFGIMFVYSASYLVIARGMLLDGVERRPTSGGVPLTRPA
jgi:hypothetical protein